MHPNDPQDMMGAVRGLPEQCADAKRIAMDADLGKVSGAGVRAIVLAGMGGSAIGGDLVAATFEGVLTAPMRVVRDYHIPAYVGADTLFLASSNSGNTEETLAAYDAAKAAGARIVALSTGGELAQRAARDGVPLVSFPGGLQPRAALGYALVPVLAVLARLDLMPRAVVSEVDEAVEVLGQLRSELEPDAPHDANPARRLAAHFHGKIPVVYGSQAERGVVAYRWKTQINENAKAFAIANVFPELNHNETVGWSGSGAQRVPERHLAVCVLRDRSEPAQIVRRVELTKQLVGERVGSVDEVWSRGKSALARALSLTYIGDFASVYLAYAYNEDPTPVKAIDWLKAELAKV